MDSLLKLTMPSKQDFASMTTPLDFSKVFSGQDISVLTAMATPLNLSILACTFASAFAIWPTLFPSKLKEIPGPRGLPILGNLCDWPSEFQAERIEEWKEKYGTYFLRFNHYARPDSYVHRNYDKAQCFRKHCHFFNNRKDNLRYVRQASL